MKKKDVERSLRCTIPGCHSGDTKNFGITFYTTRAESCLLEYEENQTQKEKMNDRLPVRYERFFHTWKRAREKSGVYLKPKNMRDFFSQEMGKAFVPDRYIDVFQGRTPRNVFAKYYNPHGIEMLRKIYEKANLRVLE